ncbi:helix-turn-helix domain-containing protein [Catenulispora rubra]|uniref:helix-turn-helix domain-containing protein n=1 Tax=Catenulispora rubra TaxID=280293 RepID=UPI0018924C24|nr:helix-turn-helix transcriptional regulator [Catenulispora rubra]
MSSRNTVTSSEKQTGVAMTAGSGAQERMLSELERLKVGAGMSFAQLQSAVPYSRSALHRYFTGQSPIPLDALVAVVRACGGDEAAMVRIWVAAQCPDSEEQPDEAIEAADPPSPSQAWQHVVRAWFALAFVIVAIMAVRPRVDSSS